MLCHLCRKHLLRQTLKGRSYWTCPKCLGAMFPYSTLGYFPEAAAALAIVKAKAKNLVYSGKPCPICCKKMRLAYSGGGTTELDACDNCKLAWFDCNEYQTQKVARPRFGSVPPQPVMEEPVRNESTSDDYEDRERINIEKLGEEQVFGLITGLPLEEGVPPVSRVIVLPVLISACILFSMFYKLTAPSLAFWSTEPWRAFGLTWLTSTFIHANIVHLFSNGYFLWLYGDNVEDILGPWRFVEIFFLGSIGGHLLALLFGAPNSSYVGASGAVMGLAVFYTLSFPKARFSYLFPGLRWVTRIRIPVFFVTFLYLLIDYMAAKAQIRGETSISHLSHLGGALVGFLYWCLADRPNRAAKKPK